jgi:hypothetical protein
MSDMDDVMDEFDGLRASLAESAADVSDLILDRALAKIDAMFGKGFSKANPALVASYLEATAMTFQNDLATAAQVEDDNFFEDAMEEVEFVGMDGDDDDGGDR